MPPSTAARYNALRLSSLAVLFTAPTDAPLRHPDVHVDCDSFAPLPAKRIAIIGAGSAGASTAYYINRFRSPCQPTNITVYEAADYVGGRSTTVNVYGNPAEPVELGASIFVQVNRNLVSAAREFGLETTRAADARPTDSPDMLGVWDGQAFKFVQSEGSAAWWNVAKLLWQYGLAPLRTQRLVSSIVGNFTRMYDAPAFPFRSLSRTARDLGLTAATAETGYAFLVAHGIAAPFATDIVQASTRVNYAQNVGEINGLLALVCMSTDGAMAVRGGNWQIFDGMLHASGASLRLRTRVSAITDHGDGTYRVRSEPSDPSLLQPEPQPDPESHPATTYDEVVLAAPFQFAHLKLPASVPHTPAPIPYVRLHVTLLASPHRLSPLAFHLPPSTSAPTVILTTLPAAAHLSPPGARAPAGFFSISTLRTVHNAAATPPRDEHLYKIFSPQPLNASFVAGLLGFGTQAQTLGEITTEDLSWVYEKVWDSYPYLPPRVAFEELSLGKGVWYTSAVEGFISTMETSSLMGMNVARLMVDGWEGEEGKEGEDHREDHGEDHGGL
ncbi:hypothetical protein MMC27_001880 [Xylographa pallens]|nr:hypothetical protein [Xylographa pallens]